MVETESAASARIIGPLTGIRGFAAFWVVLYHLGPTIVAAYPGLVPLHHFVNTGYLGVDLFSLLSGFIISYNYSEKLNKWDLKASGRYLWLRFVRTYPLHLFVLILFLMLFIWDRGLESLSVIPYDYSFLRQLFLLNGLGFESVWAWNVPSWSLSSEWFCYLCFPLLVPLINCIRSAAVALLFAALAVMLTAALLAYLGRPNFDATLDWGLFKIAGEFLAGCFLCRAYLQMRVIPDFSGVIGLAAIIYSVVQLAYFPSVPIMPVIASFAVFIFTLAHNRQPLTLLFGNAVSVYLGKISYSVYMVHWIYVGNMAAFGFNALPAQTRIWWVLGAVLCTSVITYHLVERITGKYLREMVLAGNKAAGSVYLVSESKGVSG